VYIQFNIP